MGRFLALVASVLVLVAVLLLANPAPAPASGPFDEPRAVIGPGCVRNSECSDGLVCMAGRCRSECVNNRDCHAGAHCVIAATGIGNCVLDQAPVELGPDAQMCVNARDCTGGACSHEDDKCR